MDSFSGNKEIKEFKEHLVETTKAALMNIKDEKLREVTAYIVAEISGWALVTEVSNEERKTFLAAINNVVTMTYEAVENNLPEQFKQLRENLRTRT